MLFGVATAKFFRSAGAIFVMLGAIFMSAPAAAQSQGNSAGNADVRALFASWEQSDRQRRGVFSIPSAKPVHDFTLTSSYGTRSDPFRGSRRMHNGLDMAGPQGTPIYATADGVITRSGWFGGYGRYISINHGAGIETRYGHMSELLVGEGVRVRRGQLIGRMGSTGRSTGSHLHYEVRIDGEPVNPTPFLTSGEYLASLPARGDQALAMGGGSQ